MKVPFPFVETNRRRYRPGLVVSDGIAGGGSGLLWVVMITSAVHESWVDDVEVGPAYRDFGLPIASRIRVAKIAAITPAQATFVGRMDRTILAATMLRIVGIIGSNNAPATGETGHTT